jgi:phospholipase D1/2
VRHPFVKAGLLLAGLVILALLWHYGPLRDWFSLRNVETLVVSYRHSPAAPFVVTLAFIAGSVLMVPLTLMIMACALAFEPMAAFAYGLCGGVAAGAVGFWLGRLLGRDLVKKLAGKRITALTRRLARRGVRSMLLVHMVPLLPFTVTNLAAGASGVKFLDFLAGTALGLCPGLLALSLLSKGLENAIVRPGVGSTALLLGIAALALLALRSLRKLLATAVVPPSETRDEEQT